MATAAAARLEDLTPGARVTGAVPGRVVTVRSVRWFGGNAVEVTYRDDEGVVGETVLYRDHEPGLSLEETSRSYAFDGDPGIFRQVAEALRIRMAARYDPMVAVTTSDLDPLPHQIRAVYGELLPRTPLRFLLADDPGAGRSSWPASTPRSWPCGETWRGAWWWPRGASWSSGSKSCLTGSACGSTC